MAQLAHGWQLEIDRGPDWLFVRPHSLVSQSASRAGDERFSRGASAGDEETPELADEVWALVQQNFARRLVLELNDVGPLDSHLIGELLQLYKRFCGEGWLMRICGLSSANQAMLDECLLGGRLPCYDCRSDAVKAARPSQPR
jgi:hypothetical protein